MRSRILALATAVAPDVVAVRRDFHKYPELGFTEFRTASLIARRCSDLGYSVKVGREVMKPDLLLGLPSEEALEAAYQRAEAAGADPEYLPLMRGGMTGVVAEWRTNRPGPTIALRFDTDAIPVTESTAPNHVPHKEGFASVHPGVMHSCGHDGHAAIGLGVAEVLTKMADQLSGTIRLIFQPAEEGCRGAYPMTEAGVVDGVDYLLSVHLGLGIPSGHVYPMLDGLLASTKLDVTFTGVPAHAGGKPHAGRNAALALAQAVQALYAISRHSDGSSRVNVGVLSAGTGRNVIPANAYMAMEVRGETDEILAYMEHRAHKVLEGVAIAQEVELQISVEGRALTSNNSPELASLVAEEAAQVPGLTVHNEKFIGGGSDDFTVLGARVREQGGQVLYVALGSEIADFHHTYGFDFVEADMVNGVALFAMITARLCGQA